MNERKNTSDINHIESEIYNQTRLELFARQFARQYVEGERFPGEEARLAIVTEQLRRLIPRVTVEDFEILEQIPENAAEIEAEDVERRCRLGIE
jgi:hypothetical protein